MMILTLLLPFSLSTKAAKSPEAQTVAPAPAVQVNGALREIMHMGRTERTVDLAGYIGRKGAYGLGALEALSGEVTLYDGELWLGEPDGKGGAVSAIKKRTTAGATLMVSTKVSDWAVQTLDSAVGFADLDTMLKAAAIAAGVDPGEPFAFRIEGEPTRLDWHVIDGTKIGPEAKGHASHIKTAVRGSLNGETVSIIGFYSPKHHAVFTHHDTNSHAHVIAAGSQVSGHVDHMDLAKGMRLFLATSVQGN